MFNVEEIRKDFPILTRRVNDQVLAYLDSAATTQKPRQVIERMQQYYTSQNSNVHRGVYTLAEEATAIYEQVRKLTAEFIHASSPDEIIFTRNTTEAINLVAWSYGFTFLKPGDEILLTGMEHHSNLVPWQLLAERNGAVLRFIPVLDDGTLDLQNIDTLITSRTKFVGITHVSNVLGTINPIREIIKKAHAAGAVVLVDGAQSTPHFRVDVQDLDCDFFAFSSHKMLGPMGIGVLYGKHSLLESMPPFLGGGDMIREVRLDHSTYADIPQRFEAGTQDVGGVAGFGEALIYLQRIGLDDIHQHETQVIGYALEKLRELNDVRVFGPTQRSGVISFTMDGTHPHDISTILDQQGIEIRAGHHCAQPLMRRFNVAAMARVSVYLYTTIHEIDRFIAGLANVRKVFHRGS